MLCGFACAGLINDAPRSLCPARQPAVQLGAFLERPHCRPEGRLEVASLFLHEAGHGVSVTDVAGVTRGGAGLLLPQSAAALRTGQPARRSLDQFGGQARVGKLYAILAVDASVCRYG